MANPLKMWIFDEGSSEHVAGLLRLGARQAADTKIVMDKIINDLFRIEKLQFSSQGRRGGGSWRPLLPDTIRKKGIGGNNILRTDLARPGYSKIDGADSSDTLYHSLTRLGAPYQILTVTNASIVFGTDRPYAGAHQSGSWLRYIPPRPFIRILSTDEDRWMRLISLHLMKPFVRGSKAGKE